MSYMNINETLKLLIENNYLPKIKGKYRYQADLSKMCWFGSGGNAQLLYIPLDIEDLSFFLQEMKIIDHDHHIPITVIGIGSNLLVRDDGVSGIVIRLGRGFAFIDHKKEDYIIEVGAAALDINLAKEAMNNGLGGLEFFSGIPGTIGGALAMNAGAYGNDTASVLCSAKAISLQTGEIKDFRTEEIGYHYRGKTLSKDWIFVSAEFKARDEENNIIQQRMNEIQEKRESSQPIKARTSGSTFKNPDNYKAWQLIDQAGCRGMRIGGAHVSEMHCNFFINDNNATSNDIETLIKKVKEQVLLSTGIYLQEEIEIIGK